MKRKRLSPFLGSTINTYRLNHKVLRNSGIWNQAQFAYRKLKVFSAEQQLYGYPEQKEGGEIVLKMFVDAQNNTQEIKLY